MPEIEITLNHPEARFGIPVCLVDGKRLPDRDALRAIQRKLGIRRAEAAAMCGKRLRGYDAYLRGEIDVPANAWNAFALALASQGERSESEGPLPSRKRAMSPSHKAQRKKGGVDAIATG